jgi:hypothetical protein
MRFGNHHCVFAVLRFEHMVSMPSEDRAEEAAYTPFVIAQKDRLSFGHLSGP